jgi:hypothetical protein
MLHHQNSVLLSGLREALIHGQRPESLVGPFLVDQLD